MAAKLSIDADGLQTTIERFNQGATIGSAMTFGYIAAHHAARP